MHSVCNAQVKHLLLSMQSCILGSGTTMRSKYCSKWHPDLDMHTQSRAPVSGVSQAVRVT